MFGCDDCLDICPYNVLATPTAEQAFHPSSFTLAPHLDDCSRHHGIRICLSDFGRSPIRRAKHAGFLRNSIALRSASVTSGPLTSHES